MECIAATIVRLGGGQTYPFSNVCRVELEVGAASDVERYLHHGRP